MYMVAPPGYIAVQIDIENERQARKMARFIYGLKSLPNGTLVLEINK